MEHIRERVNKASGFVYGSGEPELLRQAGHAKGLRIRGYYRSGTLPGLLRRDKIAVAILPSIWPEVYATVVDECLATGVPVVTFDLGAAADRLSFLEVGGRVSRDLGAEGLAEAAANILSREGEVPDSVIRALPQADRTARKHFDLYRSFRPRKR
jgi:glycosyltransferase involved in cell wall biosynthesis